MTGASENSVVHQENVSFIHMCLLFWLGNGTVNTYPEEQMKYESFYSDEFAKSLTSYRSNYGWIKYYRGSYTKILGMPRQKLTIRQLLSAAGG